MLQNFMYVFLCFFCVPRRLRAPGVTEGPRSRGPVGKGCTVRMVRGTCAHVVGARYFLGLAVMQVVWGPGNGANVWRPGHTWGSRNNAKLAD